MGNRKSKLRVINRYGQPYRFKREEIETLDQLKPGDHIAYEQLKLYWHHMIVETVDLRSHTINVIHYYNTAKNFSFETFPKKATVRRDSHQFIHGKFFRIIYDPTEEGDTRPNSPETVLRLAKEKLCEDKYNAFFANCEHFCTWCVINEHASPQVEILKNWLLRSLDIPLRFLADVVLEILSKCALVIAKAVVLGVRYGVAAVGAILEIVLAIWDIYKAKKKKEEGMITEEHFYEALRKRLVALLVMVLFPLLFQMIIPIPVVGGLIGDVLGHVAGLITIIIISVSPPLLSVWIKVKQMGKRLIRFFKK